MGKIRDVAVCEFIDIVLQSIDSQVRNCLKYGLACRDPPATNSIFLRDTLGLTEFRVKRFWKVANALSKTKLTIYKVKNVEFDLLLIRKKNSVYVVDGVLFVDTFDCEACKGMCREVANTNLLYLYISGSVGGSSIKVNAVYVLKKIAEVYPTCYTALIELARALALSGDIKKVVKGITCLFKILKESKKFLSEILPVIPRNINELLIISPILGKLTKSVLTHGLEIFRSLKM
ncbi:MAG: hypothetical protein J7L12_00725 [Desulfurococcales archaeon]|nr:hypothetical protein [Desulfurococcales archaeon]